MIWLRTSSDRSVQLSWLEAHDIPLISDDYDTLSDCLQ